MTLPMSDGPRDGDFSRYVETLAKMPTTSAVQPSASPPSVTSDRVDAPAVPPPTATPASVNAPATAAVRAPTQPRTGMGLRLRWATAVALVALTYWFERRWLTVVVLFMAIWIIGSGVREWAAMRR